MIKCPGTISTFPDEVILYIFMICHKFPSLLGTITKSSISELEKMCRERGILYPLISTEGEVFFISGLQKDTSRSDRSFVHGFSFYIHHSHLDSLYWIRTFFLRSPLVATVQRHDAMHIKCVSHGCDHHDQCACPFADRSILFTAAGKRALTLCPIASLSSLVSPIKPQDIQPILLHRLLCRARHPTVSPIHLPLLPHQPQRRQQGRHPHCRRVYI